MKLLSTILGLMALVVWVCVIAWWWLLIVGIGLGLHRLWELVLGVYERVYDKWQSWRR